jgi:hypothetical protein
MENAQGSNVGAEVVIKPEVVPAPRIEQGTDAERLIALAIDKGTPIETMEKLLAMRRELKEEQAKEAYYAALAAFQAECPTIPKTQNVSYTGVNYKYAPLDIIVATIKDALKNHGFSYTVTTKQTETSVTAICNAHHEQGHTEPTEFTIPVDSKSKMNDAQRTASALTYAKRYAFCNAFGIMTGDEDDDAQGAGERHEGRAYARPAQPPPQPHVSEINDTPDIRDEINRIIDTPGFPADVRANMKKYIARADAKLPQALANAKERLRITLATPKPEPVVTGDGGALDEGLEVPKKAEPEEQEMFGNDPYHHGG